MCLGWWRWYFFTKKKGRKQKLSHILNKFNNNFILSKRKVVQNTYKVYIVLAKYMPIMEII
jgi:hypothetical protein